MSRVHSIATMFVFALSLLLSAGAHAETAAIHDNHMKFNGIDYFRVGADRVTLGAYGEKKSPVLKGNYLERQKALPADKLNGKVTTASVVAIDFSSSTKADIEANLAGIKVVGANTAVTYEDLHTGKVKLVHLVVTPGDIKDATNATSSALSDLKSYGKDARIAHEIWTVMSAELADSFTASNSFEVKGTTTTGITITGKHDIKGGRDTTVVLSVGSTFAYLLVKLDWNATKTKLDKCTDDRWGPS